MKIKMVEDKDLMRYNDLALSHGTLFDTTNWTAMFGRNVVNYGIFNRGEEMIGGFFLYRRIRYGLSILQNPCFTPAIGPFLKVDAKNVTSVLDVWKEAMSLMAEFIDAVDCSVVSLSLNTVVQDMQPYIWKKFKVVPSYTYILDLSSSEGALWDNMSHERRKNIRKAEKDGLVVHRISDFGIVKELSQKTFVRQGMRPDTDSMERILKDFAKPENSFGFVTTRSSFPIACTFCVYDKKTAYYLIGGYDDSQKHHGAGAMAMWEAIKYAKSIGLNRFDFEGSMVPQIERYFRGFGGRLTPYYRINKAKLPLELILKFFKRELF